jgi:3-oxoacyl-[acyl-carrier protein] reductase
MVDDVLKQFGKIDILVNNAGVSFWNPIYEIPEETWNAIIGTNLTGTLFCIQAVAKPMMKQKTGKIINISSVAGWRPPRPGVAAYCASKAGVDMLTRVATLDLAPYGIVVNSIAPGSVESPFHTQGRTAEQIKNWEDRAKGAPIGRAADPQEIANVALFLASDESSFIRGEVIVADGGRSARMT